MKITKYFYEIKNNEDSFLRIFHVYMENFIAFEFNATGSVNFITYGTLDIINNKYKTISKSDIENYFKSLEYILINYNPIAIEKYNKINDTVIGQSTKDNNKHISYAINSAKHYGITNSGIQRELNHTQLKMNKNDLISKLKSYNGTKPVKEMADELGYSEQYIRKVLNKNNISYKKAYNNKKNDNKDILDDSIDSVKNIINFFVSTYLIKTNDSSNKISFNDMRELFTDYCNQFNIITYNIKYLKSDLQKIAGIKMNPKFTKFIYVTARYDS